MINKDKILVQFAKEGFFENQKLKQPTSLLWQPNLILNNELGTYYILFRASNTLLPAFLDRISKTASKFNSLIIFEKKCTNKEENEIISQGISIGYFICGKLILKIRTQKKEIAVETKKKLSVIDIFISSKQDISEREFVAERIETIRKIYSYPFNPPKLIEYHKFDIKDLYNYINSQIDICEWIIILLQEEYSEVVRHEIKRAIKKIEHNNIFMFVKSTKVCQATWKKELDLIKKLESKSIKYLPYSSLADLEITMTKAINVRMNQIYKKNKISITN